MIDIASAIPTITSRIKSLAIGDYIELLTFKKDRSLKVVKLNENELLLIEKGYQNEEFQLPAQKLKKTLRTLIKKEFPRSNKAHLTSGTYTG